MRTFGALDSSWPKYSLTFKAIGNLASYSSYLPLTFICLFIGDWLKISDLPYSETYKNCLLESLTGWTGDLRAETLWGDLPSLP